MADYTRPICPKCGKDMDVICPPTVNFKDMPVKDRPKLPAYCPNCKYACRVKGDKIFPFTQVKKNVTIEGIKEMTSLDTTLDEQSKRKAMIAYATIITKAYNAGFCDAIALLGLK